VYDSVRMNMIVMSSYVAGVKNELHIA